MHYIDTKQRMDEATRLYVQEGKTVNYIAKKFGYEVKTIYRYLKINGVKLRPQIRDNKGRFAKNLPLDTKGETE